MKDYLRSLEILSEKDLSLLEGKTYERRIPKDGFFIREGKVSQEVAFIKSGEFRSYYYSSSGEEVTHCILLPNSFMTAYSSFITNEESQESIQALSDAELVCISKESVLELEEQSVSWLKLSKLIAQQEYINLEKRLFLLQKETAETRYAHLIATQPELLQLVSLEQLSSYLGITPRHLSRIRGAMTI